MQHKPTLASPRAQELARSLRATRVEPVHADVLVTPSCPISRELRREQDARIATSDNQPGFYPSPRAATQT